jgi:hypothetical protein
MCRTNWKNTIIYINGETEFTNDSIIEEMPFINNANKNINIRDINFPSGTGNGSRIDNIPNLLVPSSPHYIDYSHREQSMIFRNDIERILERNYRIILYENYNITLQL